MNSNHWKLITGEQQKTGEYENINTWCFKRNPSPKDHTTLRYSAFYVRRRAKCINPVPTGISSSGSSYSSVLIRPGVYRRKRAEPAEYTAIHKSLVKSLKGTQDSANYRHDKEQKLYVSCISACMSPVRSLSPRGIN
jgi:hypothetical protein